MFDMTIDVDEESVAACADALSASVLDERRVAATKMARVARWADTHPPETMTGLGGRGRSPIHNPDLGEIRGVPRGRSRSVPVQVGGDGTPLVSEEGVVELGPLLQTTTSSAQALLRDVLDLQHRLPSVWHAVMTGAVEDWRARKAACLTRTLSFEQARVVDREVLEALTGLPYARAIDVIEARVIAADPAAHETRRQLEQERRYVALGRRPNAAGLRTVVAQTSAGDVARFDAMVDHVARLLAEAGDTDSHQVRRAKAIGILADPAQACLLMSGLTGTSDGNDEPQRDETAPGRAATWGEALRSLGVKAIDRLRPRTVLYLHLSEEALRTHGGNQVARSNLGPLGLEQLEEWLGADRLVVKPVIDLHEQVSVDAYEVPKRVAERLRLREPYEVFPYGTVRADQADVDHTVAYVPPDEGGPSGQTRTGNLGPLGRRHHNVKTFGAFRCHQPLPGLYLWELPCGLWFRVDHTGSTPLGRETPDVIRQLRPAERTRAELAWSSLIVAA